MEFEHMRLFKMRFGQAVKKLIGKSATLVKMDTPLNALLAAHLRRRCSRLGNGIYD